MPGSYMPSKQADQVDWASNFNQVIGAKTVELGLTATQVAAFNTVTGNVTAAWSKVVNPATRTKIALKEKDTALNAMKVMARNLVGIIQSTPTVSDAQKQELLITIRKTHPTPPTPVTEKPTVKKKSVDGRSISFTIERENGKRGRPAKTIGTAIYWFLGENPKSATAQWTYVTTTGKNAVTLSLGASETNTTVWVVANYLNGAKDLGPASDPVNFLVPAGSVLPGEKRESEEESIKLAA